MNRYLLLLLVVFGSISTYAQQRPQYSQYMVNQFVLNPAIAGTEEFIDVKAGFRYQWLGMSSAPVTYYLSGHMPLGRPRKSSFGRHKNQKSGWHGLGAYLYHDITGPIRHTAGYLAYAYNLPLTENIRMSLGANAGIQRFGLNGNDFILKDENDLVLNGVKNTVIPDLNAGAWLYGKTWYYGLAVHQLLQNELVFNGVREIGGPDGNKDMSKLNNHYFMTAGYFYKFKHDYAIVPSVLIKYVNPAPVSVDISARLVFKDDVFWFGASYRGLDSFTGLIGTTLFNGTMPISYSFDLSHTELIKYNTGSHEIVIGYRIPPNPKVPCPNNFWN